MPTQCPSKPYLEMVKTRTGLTPDKPWRGKLFGSIDLPSSAEYEEWYLLAYELSDAMWKHYRALGDLEAALAEQDPARGFPEWNKHVEQVNEILDARKELINVSEGVVIVPTLWISEIEQAVKVSVNSMCAMELIDQSIIQYGLTPPVGTVSPKAPPATKEDKPKMGILGTIGVVTIAAGIFGGAIYLSRREE